MFIIDRTTRAATSLVTEAGGDRLLVSNAGTISATRRFLTTDNTAAGTRDMNVNGSVSPVRYRIGPPAGQVWGGCLLVVAVSDNASFNQTDFGAIGGPLTNGLYLGFSQMGVDIDLFSGFRIKQNSDWMGLPAKTALTTWGGAAQTLEARFSPFEETGQYLLLDGDLQHEIWVQVQDNLTTLTGMRAVARYVRLK